MVNLRYIRKITLISIFLVSLTACHRSPQLIGDRDGDEDESSSQGKFTSLSSSSTVGEGRGDFTASGMDSVGQPKKKVFALNFWNDTPIQQDSLGTFAAEELLRGLGLTRRVIVPPDTKSDYKTEDLIQGEKVKVAQLIREGRRLGVAVLIIGRIKRISFRQKGEEVGLLRQKQSIAGVELEIKLFDMHGGREMMDFTRSGEYTMSRVATSDGSREEYLAYQTELARKAIREAVASFIPDILKSVEKMIWQGRVVKIQGTKVYINSGKNSGLTPGEILRVLNVGDDIYDPMTGAYLGRSQGQLKGTLEVIEFLGSDAAVSQIHTGGNFHEGDLIQLY